MKKLLVALVALLIAASPAFAEEAKELNVFSWSEYIPQEVVNGFTKETGIKVVLSTYESNEAMYAKLKLLGAKGYDLVVPSGYFVEVMAQDNLLAKLDKSKIKGLGNLDPASLNQPFDRGNALTIPYMWGTVGLLVNKKAVDVSTIKSWKDLARPEFKGRVLLSDDLRDTFGVGLKACGYSINSTNPDEIKAAYEWLKALKPSVRVFDVTATKQAFISEEVESAPAIRAMIGSFALQGINVVVIIVILRSRSFSMVREAIIPGTPQPVPMSMGMKDLPERPNLRKIRSMTKAIRAI